MSKPLHVVTKPHHLAARFFGSLSKRPPDADDVVWARAQLLDGEAALWEQHNNIDKRHTIKVARRFVAAYPEATRAEIAGALLHDVGKITSQLSTWERVVASLVGARTERFQAYHDHDAIGAELAAAAGSAPETVDLIAERGDLYPILKSCDRA